MPYAPRSDPYCYPDSEILKNIPGIRSQRALARYEARMSALRAEEPLPSGRFSPTHYRAIHHHLFQDVYSWAGKYRTVRLAKSGNMFCYPEHVHAQMKALFAKLRTDKYLGDRDKDEFAAVAAEFLATLNAIHPFREGNGRTQMTFLAVLAANAGHPLNFQKLKPKPFLDAMIASFDGDTGLLAKQLRALV